MLLFCKYTAIYLINNLMDYLFLLLACFLQGFQQLADENNVAAVRAAGYSPVQNIHVVQAGVKQDGLQCGCQLLGSVVRYHTCQCGHVIFRHHGLALPPVKFVFLKGYLQLTPVILCAERKTAGFKTRLYLLHIEEVTAHVPGTIPECELTGVIAQQPVKGMDGLLENVAISRAAYPLLAAKTEETAVADNALSAGYADKKVVDHPCEFSIQPLGKPHSYTVVGAPCPLLEFGRISLPDYNHFRLCFEYIRITLTDISGTAYHPAGDLKIFLCRFCFQSIIRFFPKRLRHCSEIDPAVTILAFYRQFLPVYLDGLNQILIVSHIDKNCDIREKPSVGVTDTYYGGRRKSPVLSFRPP